MALLWFDGFESYNSLIDFQVVKSPLIDLIEQGGYGFNASCGRRSSYGSRNGSSHWYLWTLANNYASFIFGIALIRAEGATVPTYNSSYPVFAFYDSATIQLRFHVVGSEIHAYHGDGTKLGETSGALINYNEWRYIEIKVTINDSSGSIIIRSGEVIVLNLSGIDTKNSANAYLNKVRLAGIYNITATYFDDMYFCDLTGSKNNDFLGDIRIDSLRPNGAGTYTDFTPSAGSNYQNVDESPGPDDDTTYNDGSNVADKDSYALVDLPSPAGTTIHGVKDQITVRKTDAGVMECKILTVQGGSDYLGDTISLSDSFTTHTRIMEDNPDDSAAWEDADISGGEVGVEITA